MLIRFQQALPIAVFALFYVLICHDIVTHIFLEANQVYRKKLLFGLLIALFCISTFSANAQDVEKGLWMYLPLNEGAGNTVKDHGPNGFKTESSKKAPKWVKANNKDQPKMGNALEFDGKEQ
jgi:hypothetical protein